jgi:hypothetical protein
MDNRTIELKIKSRLNKIDSQDYDNVERWTIVEAFNKGQVSWCRRNLHGLNIKQTGDEGSKRRIDDLQILLTPSPITLVKRDLFYESSTLPGNYFEWKKVSLKAKHPCCKDARNMVVYLVEEANTDLLLRDENKKPSFEWGETFCTLINNRLRIYTNNEFDASDAELVYYRQPRRVEFAGTRDPYTLTISPLDIECEFKDDIVELFIDEAVKIIAGDIESVAQTQIAQQQVEGNN